MKFTSFLLAFCVGLFGFVIFPYFFIRLNIALDLPIISYGFLKPIGVLFFISGLLLVFYCSYLFKIIGKGTPAPIEPPKNLVVKGIYKYTRNPIYLGYWMIILGEFLFLGYLGLLIYLLFFIIGIHLLVVIHEEKALEKRFGTSYINYKKSTPRYFPKIF